MAMTELPPDTTPCAVLVRLAPESYAWKFPATIVVEIGWSNV